jgi:hypothetical protein
MSAPPEAPELTALIEVLINGAAAAASRKYGEAGSSKAAIKRGIKRSTL